MYVIFYKVKEKRLLLGLLSEGGHPPVLMMVADLSAAEVKVFHPQWKDIFPEVGEIVFVKGEYDFLPLKKGDEPRLFAKAISNLYEIVQAIQLNV